MGGPGSCLKGWASSRTSGRAREMASRSTSRAFEGEAAGPSGPRVRGRSRLGEEMAQRGSAASIRRRGAGAARRSGGPAAAWGFEATPEASRDARLRLECGWGGIGSLLPVSHYETWL